MKRSLFLWVSFIIALTAPLLYAAEAAKPSGQVTILQEILILNSYHPGYAWSDDEQTGIIDVFRAKNKNWVPVIEYLDLRRLPDRRHLTGLRKLFRFKYQNKKFSVVIAMDNPALEFAVDNQSELFGNAPIVFCGINNYSPSLLKGRTDATGIVESIDIAGTIEVMLRLHPATQEIFSPHDYTASGLAVRKELEALAPRFAKVRFRFNDPLTMEELLEDLERLPKDSLVLEIGFITDKSGRTFDISETTELFYEHSPVPIYSTYEQRLGFGIVGGKLLNPRIHGTNAARIALRVLAGEKASAIPVVSESDSQFMFDYKIMSRFGIPLSALPKGSIVINKPVSFYAAHGVVIQTALGIIVFLLIVIFLLAVIITQRKRAEYKLFESEKHYRMLFDTIDEGFCIVEVIFDENEKPIDYRFLEINPSFERQTGLIDAQGKRMRELAPRHEEHWFEIYGEIALTGQSLRFVRRAEQLHRWYDVYAFRVGQPENRQVAILFNDITESKRMEEVLRKSEENFRRSLEDSPLGVRIVTAEGETIYANRAMLDIYGYDSLEELRITPVEKRYTPESFAEHQIRKEKRKQGDYYPSEYDISIIKKDDEIRHLQVFRKEVLWNGERQFQVIYQDITDRKRAEEMLRESEERFTKAFRSIPDALVISRLEDGKIVEVNDSWHKVFGHSSEDVIGKSSLVLNLFADSDDRQRAIALLRKQGFVRDFELQIRQKSGALRTAILSIESLEIHGDQYLLTVVQDITDRKRAEEALQKSDDNLRRAEQIAHVGYWSRDEASGEITWSDECYRIFGLEPQEIKLNLTALFNHIHPQDRQMVSQAIQDAVAGIRPYDMEYRALRPDGTVRWVHSKGEVSHNADGKPEGMFGVLLDITDRKQAEETLQTNKAQLSNAMEMAHLGHWEYDVANDLFTFNDQFYNIFRTTVEQVGGYTMRSAEYAHRFVHPDDSNVVREETRKAIETTDPHFNRQIEHRMLYADGTVGYITVRFFIVKDSHGRTVKTYGVNQDITERKQAEEVLRSSQEMFQKAFHASPNTMVIHNLSEGRHIDVNESFLRVVDYRREEVIGRTALELGLWWDLAQRDEYLRILREKKSVRDLEVCIRKKSGEASTLLLSAEIIEVAGQDCVILIGKDITKRKQAERDLRESEEKYHSLFTRSRDAILLTMPDGSILDANPAACEMFGRSLEEIQSVGRKDLVDMTDPRLNVALSKRARRGTAMAEITMLRANGEKFPVEISSTVFVDESGQQKTSMIIHDITERKKAEEELRVSRGQMRALAARLQAVREEERTDIAREIHDELGGALTGLRIDFSFLERAASTIENETVRTSFLTGIGSMVKSIDATIQTMRTISMKLRPGVLDDLGLVAALEWQLKDFEKRSGIRCEFVPPVEDISLDADLSTALFRIVQEALTNVARHSGATEVIVRLRVDADSSALEVEDNGKGIEKEKALGKDSLGLLGMRERVQMFGGRISVTGTPGICTKVTVEIPPVEKRKMDRDREGAAG
jgi:PAS domain S-box-containing protein